MEVLLLQLEVQNVEQLGVGEVTETEGVLDGKATR